MSKYYRHKDIVDMIEQGFSIDTDGDKAYVIHELLSSLPTIEVSDDCISRATALEIFSDLYWMNERLLNFQGELDKVYEKLRTTPNVVPSKETGKWVKNENGTYSCSECQTWLPEEQHHYARYCLYCGAKMGGDTE